MPTILITGGTGLIGTALCQMLTGKGYSVIVLSRKIASNSQTTGSENPGSINQRSVNQEPKTTFLSWDPGSGSIDHDAIRHADYIVHLAGAGVADKRWTTHRKKEIVDSRTQSCELLVKTLQEIPNQVKGVISMSGIGWYGPDRVIPNPKPFTETDPPDGAFLGETCRLWESAISPITAMGKRLVIFRTGIVLSKKGGALKEFAKPVKMGMAAILGSGKQVLSWIHIDDMCRLIVNAIEQTEWHGIYNAVSPYPVDNRTLTRTLAGRIKGRYFVQVYIPSFILKMIIGELSIEVLKSATVSAEKCRQAGFQFNYPTIESALDELLAK